MSQSQAGGEMDRQSAIGAWRKRLGKALGNSGPGKQLFDSDRVWEEAAAEWGLLGVVGSRSALGAFRHS